MKAAMIRRAALAALTLLPLLARAGAAAQDSSDFESLLQAGFKDVRAAADSAAVPEPASQARALPPSAPGGVFLHSSLDGRLAYCSATGCRLLRDGGVGVVVLAGPGALYFTGADTGYCTAQGCRVELPGVRATFPLTSGPKGDIYASDDKTGWHCTPDACRKASGVPLERYTNYIQGVYKPSGDFVSSSADGTFWCASGKCARIGGEEMIFIDENCAGTAPADAAYAFGSDIYRCTPAGCRDLGRDSNVDNYMECAFDERGRLLLPARGEQGRRAGGAILCSENGVERTRRAISSIPAVAKKAEPARSSESFLNGEDGAMYRLASHAADAEPASNAPRRLPGKITRDEDGRDAVLDFDVPMACWQWTDGDGDEDQPMWNNECRVLR